MILYKDVIQNTPEWRALRAGIPTASQGHRIVTPKGERSKAQEGYLFELLAERILGEPIEDDYQSWWMGRGKDLEADAIEYYSLQTDMDTEPCGFITTDDGIAGCSPDRLVGEDGLLEIKCVKPANHVAYLLQVGEAVKDHRTQIQMQLWVSERHYCDLLSYCPGFPEALYRIERDELFITQIRHAVEGFSVRLGELTERAIRNGWIQERKESMRDKTIVEILKESLRDMHRETA
jgi:hypothetical protein